MSYLHSFSWHLSCCVLSSVDNIPEKRTTRPSAPGRKDMLMTKQEKHKSKLITVKEVANYLVVTERTVYRLIKDPTFPAFKVGGQWRFKMEMIDDWMRRDRAHGHSSPEFSTDGEGLLDESGQVAN